VTPKCGSPVPQKLPSPARVVAVVLHRNASGVLYALKHRLKDLAVGRLTDGSSRLGSQESML
jgi:hypothetical protein